MPVIIFCHEAEVLPEFLEAAERHDVTLVETAQQTSTVMADVIKIIRRALAPRVTRHGVLVEVYGMGLLLLGESGVGKSEAAIELLKRGTADCRRRRGNPRHRQHAADGTAPSSSTMWSHIGVIDVRDFRRGPSKRTRTSTSSSPRAVAEGMLYDRLASASTR